MTCIACGKSDTKYMDHCPRHHHDGCLFVGCDCSICEDEFVEKALNGETK